ncbi:MAG: threonine/serine exporter family protein [Bacteroidales bacterium]|nr:threonine/serine exporter family protein [Bacteroidales bacterium]
MDNKRILNLAYEAGSIMLENGAEISRVEDTIQRIAGHYGFDDMNVFVLSNGIIATADTYARSKFIPIRGSSLDKVVAVNQLSRDVTQGKCDDIDQLEERIRQIRAMKNKPALEQIIASALGSAAFCIIFGGSFFDSLISMAAGLLLWVFMIYVGHRHLSRIVSTVIGGIIATFFSIGMYRLGLGSHLSNIIIGSIIPLIPGLSFTNGIRDLANEDYLSGITRLLDAMLTFLCIALGVAFSFVIDDAIFGKMHVLASLAASEETAALYVQLPAAFIGTLAFAVLFGVPRKYYLSCGLCGTLGWLLYLLLLNNTSLSSLLVVFLSAALVAAVALVQSIISKCPSTVFLISGLFPLVPGAGIFWTTYNIVSNRLGDALHTGFMAIKITIAIAFGILIVMEINSKKRIGHRLVKRSKK